MPSKSKICQKKNILANENTSWSYSYDRLKREPFEGTGRGMIGMLFNEEEFLHFVEDMDNQKEQSWEMLRSIDSPMIKQYVGFKEKHPDHIVFFQLGEFYETYLADAEVIHQQLGEKLTSKTISGVQIPMSGFPAKSGLLKANQIAKTGYKVALIQQKKNEQDEVVRFLGQIITPSSITDEQFLSKDEHQYLMSAYQMKDELGIVLLDTLSGEIETRVIHKFALFDAISRYEPKEVNLYLTKEFEVEMLQKILGHPLVDVYKLPYFYEEIKPIVEQHKEAHFKDQYIPYPVIVAHYFMMKHVQEDGVLDVTLRPIHHVDQRHYLYLHQNAVKGLELFENAQTGRKEKTLYDLLNECVTPKGSRTLKNWMQEPAIDTKDIQRRHVMVEYFLNEKEGREVLREHLSQTSDIERSLARFEKNQYKEHELVDFVGSLEKFHAFFSAILHPFAMKPLVESAQKRLDMTEKILRNLHTKISKEHIIQKGYDARFDEVRALKENGMAYIVSYFEKEKAKTGIKTMKLEEEKHLGYYFEVTKSQYDKIPEYYMERKDLSNKKKLVTNELENLKLNYLEAQENYSTLYRTMVRQIVADILSYQSVLRNLIDYVAYLDVVMSFAQVAEKYHYQKPIVTQEGSIQIENGKHPLLQAFSYQHVIPNTCTLKEKEIQVVTGPNMGGKSTYLKTVALLTIMAQIGSFVPAKMTFSPVDRVLLRMGANDALMNHQSTFMVEMEEVAYILLHATENSLILMDELGRGTSTSDGISIAYSVISYLHEFIQAKTICSTHYHELMELEEKYEQVSNYHAEAVDTENGMALTFKIIPGASNKSFGIEVAKRVGLPHEIIEMAERLSEKYSN